MERKDGQIEIDLVNRLMNRELFGGEKVNDYIVRTSRQQASDKLRELNDSIKINPVYVINNSCSKLASWGIEGDHLLHIMLSVN